MKCLKEPSTERRGNLKKLIKENGSKIWKSVLLRRHDSPQIILAKAGELY